MKKTWNIFSATEVWEMDKSTEFSTSLVEPIFGTDILPSYTYAPAPLMVNAEYCKATIDSPHAICNGTTSGVTCECNDGFYEKDSACIEGTPPPTTTTTTMTTETRTTALLSEDNESGYVSCKDSVNISWDKG